MKIVSLPLLLAGVAGLLLTGCDNNSNTVVVKESNPEVSLALTTGGTTTATIVESSTQQDVTVSFSEALTTPITVSFSTGGTATLGDDYLLQSTGVVIEPSDTVLNGMVYQATFPLISIVDDSEPESDETVQVTLSEVSYGSRALPVTVIVTIQDDADPVTKISN